VFLFQATEPADVCATVALILHYLHLVIGCWLFAHTLRTYFKLRQAADSSAALVYSDPDSAVAADRSRDVKRSIWSRSICYCSVAWTAPLPFIIVSPNCTQYISCSQGCFLYSNLFCPNPSLSALFDEHSKQESCWWKWRKWIWNFPQLCSH